MMSICVPGTAPSPDTELASIGFPSPIWLRRCENPRVTQLASETALAPQPGPTQQLSDVLSLCDPGQAHNLLDLQSRLGECEVLFGDQGAVNCVLPMF